MKNKNQQKIYNFKKIIKQNREIKKTLRQEFKNLTKDSLLYINYPFCLNFCNFCIYKIHLYKSADSKEFLKYYNKEIDLYAEILDGFKFKNIHIGGGTPNLISPELLIEPLKKIVDFKNLDRFIIEVFPDKNLPAYIKKLEKYPITKVQLGAQTLNNNILKKENRKTSKKIILNCLEVLAKSKFIWSVDLIYGFEKEILIDDRLNEFDQILDFSPHGIHFYKLRSQTENDYYGRGKGHYSSYQKEIDLLKFERRLCKRNYQKVYDEWCFGKNIEHAQISVCYNGYSGAFPSILGLGLMSKSHFRFGLGMDFKELKLYKRLLDIGLPAMRIFHNFRETNIYPIFNIYTGIKRLSRFDLGKFLKNNILTKGEKKEIEKIFRLFEKENINYIYQGKDLIIPKKQFSKSLYLLEEYMKSIFYHYNKFS